MREDTRTFLRVSSSIEAAGILCVLIVLLTGGFRAHGPTTNLGWLCLIIAMGCLPTGTLFLLLGLAKWYEDRKRT